MGQLIRIREMEQQLDEATAAIRQLDEALDRYEAAQASVNLLSTYLGSDEWRQDLADDEHGFLPPDLKRGVLSEDGIWNMLSDCRELNERLQEAAARLKDKQPQP